MFKWAQFDASESLGAAGLTTVAEVLFSQHLFPMKYVKESLKEPKSPRFVDIHLSQIKDPSKYALHAASILCYLRIRCVPFAGGDIYVSLANVIEINLPYPLK